jgi:hypothetical protein
VTLLYSPIDGSELGSQVPLYPKTAFLMLHDNDRVSKVEADMQLAVRGELKFAGFKVISATDVKRSGDYLHKIIALIQGCGFGVAVFSDVTPSRTLANIFFEIGYCLALGKPTQLVLSGENVAPSDFVRTEWISFEADMDKFRDRLKAYAKSMIEYGDYLFDLAMAAEDAEEPDLAVAFERFKRAYLIDGGQKSLDGVKRLQNKLRGLSKDSDIGRAMKQSRRSLSDEITGFMRMAQKKAD